MIKTQTGYAECLGEWRDGAMPKASAGVACLTVRDDVTTAIWRYTGKRRDAAAAIGEAVVNGGRLSREAVARLSGNHLNIETPPANLFIGKGEPNEDGEFDEFEFNAAAHPDIVAY